MQIIIDLIESLQQKYIKPNNTSKPMFILLDNPHLKCNQVYSLNMRRMSPSLRHVANHQ